MTLLTLAWTGPRASLPIPSPLEVAAISPDRSDQTKERFMTDSTKQATSHWEVGNVKITRVIELEQVGFPPGFLFDGLTEDRVKSIGWLHPYYADPRRHHSNFGSRLRHRVPRPANHRGHVRWQR